MDDLTRISGIGAATARNLIAGGIATFAALAAIEPEGEQARQLGIRADWIAAAKAKLEEPASDNPAQSSPTQETPPAHPGQKKPAPKGPVAKQEIRLPGRTYGPGETLPDDIDEEDLRRLAELGAI